MCLLKTVTAAGEMRQCCDHAECKVLQWSFLINPSSSTGSFPHAALHQLQTCASYTHAGVLEIQWQSKSGEMGQDMIQTLMVQYGCVSSRNAMPDLLKRSVRPRGISSLVWPSRRVENRSQSREVCIVEFLASVLSVRVFLWCV